MERRTEEFVLSPCGSDRTMDSYCRSMDEGSRSGDEGTFRRVISEQSEIFHDRPQNMDLDSRIMGRNSLSPLTNDAANIMYGSPGEPPSEELLINLSQSAAIRNYYNYYCKGIPSRYYYHCIHRKVSLDRAHSIDENFQYNIL